MLNRYLLTIKRESEAVMLVGYDEATLRLVEIQSEGLTTKQARWLLNTVPETESGLADFTAAYPFARVDKVPTDLSFNAFWNHYDYKIGKRDRAMKLWAALSDAEKTKVMRAIPRYKQYLALRPTIEMTYPETYLSQKRWQNEYKIN